MAETERAPRRGRRLLELDGLTLCAAEWAKRLSITPQSLHKRLLKMPLREALTKARRSDRFIGFAGETLCEAEWSERVGIAHQTMQKRLNRMPVSLALTMPRSGKHVAFAFRENALMKLSRYQTDVLRWIGSRSSSESCPSGPEISYGLGHRYRDWSDGKLRSLLARGLIEVAGSTFSNARTWRLTPAGRRALERPRPSRGSRAPRTPHADACR